MKKLKIEENELLDLKMSDNLLGDIYKVMNVSLIKRNLKDKTRSENYGLKIIKRLSKELFYLKQLEKGNDHE